MSETIKGFVCFCGHENRFNSYVFAHYNLLLKGDCGACGRLVHVFRGVTTPRRKRKADPKDAFDPIK